MPVQWKLRKVESLWHARDDIKLSVGGAFGILGTNVSVETGVAQWIIAKDRISVEQGGALAMAAGNVEMSNGFVGVLLARNITGTMRVLLDPPSAAVFGIAAGLTAGLALLILGGRRRR